MKLRNLFLAGLAAIAMASCSNEIEGVDENNAGVQLDENARMQFSIAFPKTNSTRADNQDADKNGLATEQKVQSIQLILKYDQAELAKYNKDLTFDDITNEFDVNGNVYTLKASKAISAVAGAAKVYVCINGKADAAKVALTDGAETITAKYTSLDGLANGIAKDENFLMTGKNSVTIEDQKTVTAKVAVDRVAAKISERSKANLAEFNHETTFYKLDGTTDHTEKLKATTTLVSYSFLNLNTTSYVFKQAAPFVPTATTGYFQYSKQKGESDIDFEANEFSKKEIAKENNEITYCMENVNEATPTYVVYKASVKIGDQEEGVNFYSVKDGAGEVRFYKNFAELESAYKEVIAVSGLEDGSTYAEFFAAGIIKYTSGICYYVKPINSNINGVETASIYRNNHYILTVGSITGIGSATVDPTVPTPATYLSLEVTVNPWTVQNNDFDLN